jgi:hypothetical protein
MAEQSTPSPPNVGGNGFIWIALVAASTFFLARELPLEGSRPPVTQQLIAEPAAVQDIDARLWQDPFAAVNDTLTKSSDLKANACNPTPFKDVPPAEAQNHCDPPKIELDTRVLVMSVAAAPYSDNDEFRRRTRYAVLAGLSAEGYVPTDEEHIGFYWPKAPKKAGDIPVPKYIPFEQFDLRTKPNRRVLLLWYDESVLRDAPIKQLSSLLCESFGKGISKIAVLGPQTSTPLQNMVHEAKGGKDWFQSDCPDLNLRFYVYSATTDDATLIPDDRASCSPDSCLQDFFARPGIDIGLYRMIATDEALAYAMTRELRLRGIDKPEKHGDIALVSEWDTVYGRALPESMARCLGEEQRCPPNPHPLATKTWLHPFKYLRGLDGQTPGTPGGNAASRPGDKRGKQENDTKSDTKARSDANTRDRAEGQSQFDYVRRLGEEMQQLDTDLRRKNPRGIQAIGVLGSDLYDKLLVLQALRPLFNDALFFTTDLDGLLLHPMAQTPTRNLLVASGLGLQLRSEIQGEIPPFRSSYETASFLAVRTAVRSEGGPPPPAWPTQPLVFEIGASRAFQFASSTPAASDDARQDHEQCRDSLFKCADVQPVASERYPYLSMSSAILLSIVGLSLTLISGTVRELVWKGGNWFMVSSKSPTIIGMRIIAAVIVLCVTIFALATVISELWPILAGKLTENGDPITLLEGISIWPTIFFRLLALALCVWLIFRAWKQLDDNMEKIKRELKLTGMWDDTKGKQYALVRQEPLWTSFASLFWYRLPPDENATRKRGKSILKSASQFWHRYIFLSRRTARFFRISSGVIVMFALTSVIAAVAGNQLPPTRGDPSFYIYVCVATALFLANLFLIFFVADATLLCWHAVGSFRTETAIWPAATMREFSRRLELPGSVIDNWIDLQFVKERTECITGLIYYPFLILGLLVVSRNRAFANFPPSLAMVAVTVMSILILVGCAIALHWSAEMSRTQARTDLNDEIVKAMSLEDEGRRANQLQMMLRRVNELREGAFSPFSQQPLVRAILLPLGGLGGSTLLEYLSSSGLSLG